ncbi:MAG TPA: VOC family protein [Sphingomicrobium sp.]|jgi:catechol 2,3-dioxygenase-like lactoylglutathione lyase family enzyme|nr:VOC family protein [Sphingomicrobium sp.]
MERELDGLIKLYENGGIDRRNFSQGVLALCMAAGSFSAAAAPVPTASLVRGRTINHVSINASDVRRSTAFYERLTGLPIRDQGADFCEFRLESGFLGLYAPEKGDQLGIDHFCIGIDGYEPKSLLARIEQTLPEAKPFIAFGDQLYVHDPDGAKVQFADVSYKR